MGISLDNLLSGAIGALGVAALSSFYMSLIKRVDERKNLFVLIEIIHANLMPIEGVLSPSVIEAKKGIAAFNHGDPSKIRKVAMVDSAIFAAYKTVNLDKDNLLYREALAYVIRVEQINRSYDDLHSALKRHQRFVDEYREYLQDPNSNALKNPRQFSDIGQSTLNQVEIAITLVRYLTGVLVHESEQILTRRTLLNWYFSKSTKLALEEVQFIKKLPANISEQLARMNP